MSSFKRFLAYSLATIGLSALAVPAVADVREGVDAWSRGEYSQAVSAWEGSAAEGDVDALFNLGQAYRLGRGVARDEVRARAYYAQAANGGHIQAADIYGLMLFQNGQVEQALPYVQAAANRGDPRSQYLLGIAHFNGDLVEKDWTRAYALLTLANSVGLPQAAQAIAQMDEFIPLAQREEGATLAVTMRQDADQARAVEMAAADLGAVDIANMPPSHQRLPQPIATTVIPPSVAAGRVAIADAQIANGTASPAEAGASFASTTPTTSETRVSVQPTANPVVDPAPRYSQVTAAVAAPEVEVPAPATVQQSGEWRVQLGAFGVAGNAERLWDRLSGRSEIAGRERLLVPAGRVTKLQAGGYATRSDAQVACRSLQATGQDCLVTRR